MCNFITYKLEEILTLRYGKDQKKVADINGQYPILGTGGFIGKANKFLYNKPSVLIGRKGTINNPIYMDSPFWTIDTLFYTEIDEKKVDPKYLYYRFKLINFLRYNEATGVPSLKTDTLNRVSIRIHKNVCDQQYISSILSSFDSKISLNNRINAELEAMAKLLYDYWFVQFDFPTPAEYAASVGKPEMTGKPYKSNGGKMVWNKELKREIPEGWMAKKMVDFIDSTKSGDWGNEIEEGNYTEKVTCFRGADLNGLNGIAELNPPERFIPKTNKHKILASHDLIIEISGGSPTQSTGRLAFITDSTIRRFENPLICSNFCKAISLKNKKLLYNFAFCWNSLYENGVFFGHEGKTSGIKNLLFDSFVNSFWTVKPDEKITVKFYDFMVNIQNKKQIVLAENQQLSSLRDWLLPMLMNGQVRVEETTEKKGKICKKC